MEKKATNNIINTFFFKCVDFVISVLLAFSIVALIELHFIVPFFPVLFLLDLCIIFGYPLFLRYVLKRKWFECCKDKIMHIKYILLPILLMLVFAMTVIILCYPDEILQAS